ncbi:MAG: ribosome maturation factor RimP [Candidatus Omnitrophica bacterium]|nr:ribosome maturation factor RimP [Candidatus Omnitrophota bacterium]MBL7151372.1 ribosome maturation factor RimP [Candidatus Omnitrophota bacterium]MBL7210276.1 ribosome maturation factor RimP [Candidatus Omnitrophota bacterium]
MDRPAITEEIKGLIEEFLQGKGMCLVDVICRREGGGLILRILADWPEAGITLGECAVLNREIGLILDEKDILEERYILEVSSPGLDRPLKTRSDFLRCRNKKARVFLSDFINGRLEWDGLIDKVEDQSVYIKRDKESIEIPLSKINKAKQEL